MPLDVPLFSSVAFLLLLQGPKINGVSQESENVIECIKNMIPMQGIDCMSRMIMSNHSYAFSDSTSGYPVTTDMTFQYHNQKQSSESSHADTLETLNEICRREAKGKVQTCIRNELIKRCRFSILQDRITSPPGRWDRREDREDGDGYGDWNDGAESRRRLHHLYGNRRQKDIEYQYGYSQISEKGNHRNDNMNEKNIKYSDSDSGFKT